MTETLEIRTLGGLAISRNGQPVTKFDQRTEVVVPMTLEELERA